MTSAAVERWHQELDGPAAPWQLLALNPALIRSTGESLLRQFAVDQSFFSEPVQTFRLALVAHDVAGLGQRPAGSAVSSSAADRLLLQYGTEIDRNREALANLARRTRATYEDLRNAELTKALTTLLHTDVVPELARELGAAPTFPDVLVLDASDQESCADARQWIAGDSPYALTPAMTYRLLKGAERLGGHGSDLDMTEAWCTQFDDEPLVVVVPAALAAQVLDAANSEPPRWARPAAWAEHVADVRGKLRHEVTHAWGSLRVMGPLGFSSMGAALDEARATDLGGAGAGYLTIMGWLGDVAEAVGRPTRAWWPATATPAERLAFHEDLIRLCGPSAGLDMLLMPLPHRGADGLKILKLLGDYDGITASVIAHVVAQGGGHDLVARLRDRPPPPPAVGGERIDFRYCVGLHLLDRLTGDARDLVGRSDIGLQRTGGMWRVTRSRNPGAQPAATAPSRAHSYVAPRGATTSGL